jgi:hypothetical protein
MRVVRFINISVKLSTDNTREERVWLQKESIETIVEKRTKEPAFLRRNIGSRIESRLPCKVVHGDSRRTNQTAQRAFGQFLLVGNRERRDLASFNHDNVAAALPGYLAAKLFEGPDRLAPAPRR